MKNHAHGERRDTLLTLGVLGLVGGSFAYFTGDPLWLGVLIAWFYGAVVLAFIITVAKIK